MLPSSSFKVTESTINNEAASKSNLYYGINPNILGNSKNIEDTKLQGYMLGISLNFYF